MRREPFERSIGNSEGYREDFHKTMAAVLESYLVIVSQPHLSGIHPRTARMSLALHCDAALMLKPYRRPRTVSVTDEGCLARGNAQVFARKDTVPYEGL